MGLVNSDTQPSKQGPYRRYYHLTDDGLELLKHFIERNILVFTMPAVEERIHSITSSEENDYENGIPDGASNAILPDHPGHTDALHVS
jgi:DNA-binding PadR family transcriptional regulator